MVTRGRFSVRGSFLLPGTCPRPAAMESLSVAADVLFPCGRHTIPAAMHSNSTAATLRRSVKRRTMPRRPVRQPRRPVSFLASGRRMEGGILLDRCTGVRAGRALCVWAKARLPAGQAGGFPVGFKWCGGQSPSGGALEAAADMGARISSAVMASARSVSSEMDSAQMRALSGSSAQRCEAKVCTR